VWLLLLSKDSSPFSVESVSADSLVLQGFESLSSCFLVELSVYCLCLLYLSVFVSRTQGQKKAERRKRNKSNDITLRGCHAVRRKHVTAINTSRRAQIHDWMWFDCIPCSQSIGCFCLIISSIFPSLLEGIRRLRQAYKRFLTKSALLFLTGITPMTNSQSCTLQQTSINFRDQSVHRECHCKTCALCRCHCMMTKTETNLQEVSHSKHPLQMSLKKGGAAAEVPV